MKEPNILIIMSDEHRFDVTGFTGNKVVRTPHMDRLAAEGVVFSNAYCPSPICIPCRQSFAAGQFPKHCKVEGFGEDLEPGYPTFARHFARHAYETVAAGKLHHTGVDQMQGYKKRIGMVGSVTEKNIENKNLDYFKKIEKKDFKWDQEKEIKRAGIGTKGVCEDDYTLQGVKLFIESYFLDTYYDRPSKHKPLMLYVGFNQPHYPYQTREDKFKYYLNRVKLYQNQEVFDHKFLNRFTVDASDREKIRAVASYYGMVETLDEYIGEILQSLENVGENLDDWIIIYTSDHGEMLGEHGVWEKQKFFEGSVKVPLVIRYGKNIKGGRTITQNVNLCDIYATLCDLCGIETLQGLDSRSLMPLMQNQCEDWDNESISQFVNGEEGQNLMIKRDHLKYQYYKLLDNEVLFDLEYDPEERINLINDEKYANILDVFRRRKRELGF